MAVRTVTVNMRLAAASYLADGRALVRVNNEIDDSFDRISRSAAAADAAARAAARGIRSAGRAADRAENQVRELREEIERLNRAMAANPGPLPLVQGGGGGGGGIWRGLIRAFRQLPPEAQAAAIAAGIALAVTLSLAFGAMLSGLIGVAIGGALIAGGAILAAKTSTVVQAAWFDALDPIRRDMVAFARIFEGPLVRAAGAFREAWSGIGPEIRDLFQEIGSSGAIEALVGGIAGFVREMLPGLRGGLDGLMKLVREFGNVGLPELGSAFGDFVQSITSSQGAVKGLRLLVSSLAGGLVGLGNVLNWLSIAFDKMTQWGEFVNSWLAKIPVLGKPFETIRDALSWINQAGEEGSLRTLGEQGDRAADGVYRTATAAREAEAAIQRLNDSMDETYRIMTGTRDAAIQYEQAVDDLTESIRDNGTTTDITTQKGRDNARAIDDVARAAWAAREATIEQGRANGNLAGATAAANAAFKAQLDVLAAQLRALGLTEAQIRAVLGAWYALAAAPNPVKTVTVYYRTVGSSSYEVAGGRRPGSVPGVNVYERQGGIVYARHGLMALSGQAGVATGGRPLIGFAEPGTGAEAFIAKNAPASRSLAIANAAAGWHGGQVVPKGTGSPGATYNVTVNAGIGTDGYAVGRQVVAAIKRYEQSSGTGWRTNRAGSWRG